MPLIVKANPFRCRMWDFHDRLENHVSEATCAREISSIASHGQLIPALARPLKAEANYNFELIYGARRLFIARHLNIEILLDVQQISDPEALVAMDIENRHRKDISAYERGMSYARWLRSGFFRSQEELARRVKNSPASVSRVLKLASLPSVVVDAFGDPTAIRESWGISLAEALEDPAVRLRIITRARTIRATAECSSPEEVYRTLFAASTPGAKSRRSVARDEVVRDLNGTPVFRVKYHRQSVAFVVPAQKLPALTIEAVRRTLLGILQPETVQSIENKGDSVSGAPGILAQQRLPRTTQ